MKALAFWAAAVAALFITGSVPAQVPQIVSYQGRVAVGSPPVNFDGAGQFKFALVNGGGSGIAATAGATVSGGRVTAITVTSGGFGYLTPPAVTISGGGGSGATALHQPAGGALDQRAFGLDGETLGLGIAALDDFEAQGRVRGHRFTTAVAVVDWDELQRLVVVVTARNTDFKAVLLEQPAVTPPIAGGPSPPTAKMRAVYPLTVERVGIFHTRNGRALTAGGVAFDATAPTFWQSTCKRSLVATGLCRTGRSAAERNAAVLGSLPYAVMKTNRLHNSGFTLETAR